MFNSIRDKSILAGGATFALCLVAMLAGGLTWFTGAAGWCVFLAFVLSVFAGFAMWVQLNAAEAQQWKQERRDVIDRMEDAQRCIKAEEKAHNATKRELVDVRQQLTTANALASDAKREYGNMRDRAAERGRTIDELQGQISRIKRDLADSNDTWRKQVSNMRSAAMDLYKALDDMKFSNDDLDAVQNLMDGLLALAEAGGVPAVDARQVTIDEAIAEPVAIAPIVPVSRDAWATPAETLDAMQVADYSQDLPQCQPTPLHAVQVLLAKVRANQQQRRDRLNVVYEAIESGYELSQAITIAYSRGALWVSDELISDECALIEKWRREQAQ